MNVLSSGASTPRVVEQRHRSRRPSGRFCGVHPEQLGGALDLGHDVRIRGRGARVDEALPAVHEVAGDDRVAVAVLRVLQGEGQRLGVLGDLPRLGKCRDGFERLGVDVDERPMQGSQHGERVGVLRLVGVECRRLAGDVDVEDLLSGEGAGVGSGARTG